MSPRKWDRLPWYEAVALLEGLKSQGILGGNRTTGTPTRTRPGPGIPPVVDLTEPGATVGLGGFNVRRAG